jgi:2,3-bisphosphoglycerate-independent phosphoglycerate mutase
MLSDLYFASFVMHEEKNLAIEIFTPDVVKNPIAKIWSDAGIKQFHTAETEKYAHITYYLNGGVEKPFPGEDRLMIPSPRVNTYDKVPEMSAQAVTDNLISAIKKNIYGGLVVNFANPDMVGHTGNLKATIKAVEFVDLCLGRIMKEVADKQGVTFVFADHGNAEQMVNPRTGTPDTEHTTNPVPFILVSDDEMLSKVKFRSDGNLAAIAPTVLELMEISFDHKVKEKSLIVK